MSKLGGAKHGRAPTEKTIAESKKKRKSAEQEKQDSPSRVESLPPAEKAAAASESESEDSGMRCDFYLEFSHCSGYSESFLRWDEDFISRR